MKPEKFPRISKYEKGRTLDEDYVEKIHDEGLELLEEGKNEEAIRKFEKIVNYSVSEDEKSDFIDWFEDALYHEFDAFSELGKHEKALELINNLLGFDPNDTDYLLGKGYVLEDLNRHNEALACYEKMLKIDPKDDDALVNISHTLLNMEKNKEALEAVEKAIKINSKNDDAWYNKGEALLGLGKIQEAVKSFDKVLKINRDDHETWYMMARCLAKINKKDDAVDSLLMAIGLEPANKNKAKKEKDFDILRTTSKIIQRKLRK